MVLKCARCSSNYSYNIGSGLSKTYCSKCYQMVRKEEMQKKAIEYLGSKCSLCGYNRCTAALEFHGEEDVLISKIYNWSWERVAKGLDKCDLVCCNCHKELHT